MNGIHWKLSDLTNLRHDLSTPLNAIIGYSEMLLEECTGQGWGDFCQDLQRIGQAGRALLEAIKLGLDSARIENLLNAGKNEIIDSALDFQIRTSMNAIIGYTEMLLEQAKDKRFDDLTLELHKIRTAAHLFLKLMGEFSPTQLVTGEGYAAAEQDSYAGEDLSMPNSATQAREACADTGRVRQANVLVVEDNPLNRETLTRYLGRLGHAVSVAENGQQALELVESQRFDLVLLDIMMPVLDGFQVLAQLKENMVQRDIPVIIISSLDDQDHFVKGIRMGADDCLPKPFDPIILGARVEACLERKRWHDQEQEYLTIIKAEREKSEHLLLQILPAPIAERLKQGESIIADGFDDVTILFADLVNFTPLTTQMKPKTLVMLLNDLFCMFDDLVREHGLEKIRAIGDEFVVAASLLKPRLNHAEAIADFSLALVNELKSYNTRFDRSLEMRIGIETGPVIAGVIGTTQFSYDLWGDAMNTASRMQSHGQSGRIHMTENVYFQLKDKYYCEERGMIPVKGKGSMRTYFLNGKKG